MGTSVFIPSWENDTVDLTSVGIALSIYAIYSDVILEISDP